MSPGKVTCQQGSPHDSIGRRYTRSTSRTPMVGDDSTPRTTTSNIPSSAKSDSMNRKLDFDISESDRRRELARLAPDPPSFDLDTPPDVDDKIEQVEEVAAGKISKEQTEPMGQAAEKQL